HHSRKWCSTKRIRGPPRWQKNDRRYHRARSHPTDPAPTDGSAACTKVRMDKAVDGTIHILDAARRGRHHDRIRGTVGWHDLLDLLQHVCRGTFHPDISDVLQPGLHPYLETGIG